LDHLALILSFTGNSWATRQALVLMTNDVICGVRQQAWWVLQDARLCVAVMGLRALVMSHPFICGAQARWGM
jgi:hypothetical protein